jgi:MFS transporter, DHA1 family, tetracycline resistance protein
MGVSIISPVIPFVVQPYLSNPNLLALVVGLLTSAYAICQFIAAPGLGALSDHYGRRPLLLICLLGSVAGTCSLESVGHCGCCFSVLF